MAVATRRAEAKALVRALGEFAVFLRLQEQQKPSASGRRRAGNPDGDDKRAVLAWLRGLRVDELASLCCVEDVGFVKTLLHMAALSRSGLQEFQLLPTTTEQHKRSTTAVAPSSVREFLRRPLVRTRDGDVFSGFHSRAYEEYSDAVLRGMYVLNTQQSCDTLALSMSFFAGVETSSSAAFASGFLDMMETLSCGKFLTSCPSEAMLKRRVWGETEWFAAQGYYSLQVLFVNQIELNIWAAWKQYKKAESTGTTAGAKVPPQGLVAKLPLLHEWQTASVAQRETGLKVLGAKTTIYLRNLRHQSTSKSSSTDFPNVRSALETLTSVLTAYQQTGRLKGDDGEVSVESCFACSLQDAIASPQTAVVKLLLAEHLQEQCSLLLCERLANEEAPSVGASGGRSPASTVSSTAADANQSRTKASTHSQRRRASRKKMLKQRRAESEARAAQQSRLKAALGELRERFHREQEQMQTFVDEVLHNVVESAVDKAMKPAGAWSSTASTREKRVSEVETSDGFHMKKRKKKRNKLKQKLSTASSRSASEVRVNSSKQNSPAMAPHTPTKPGSSLEKAAQSRQGQPDAEGEAGELSAATAGSDSSHSQQGSHRQQLLHSNDDEEQPQMNFFSSVDTTVTTSTSMSSTTSLGLPPFGSQSLYSSTTTPFFLSLAPREHHSPAYRATLRSRRDVEDQTEDCESNQLGSPSNTDMQETSTPSDSSNFEWYLPPVFSSYSSAHRSALPAPALDWHFNHWQFKTPEGGAATRVSASTTAPGSRIEAPPSSSSSTSSASSRLGKPLSGSTRKYSLASFSQIAGVDASRRRTTQTEEHERQVSLRSTVPESRADGDDTVGVDADSDFLYREGGFFDRQRAIKRRRRPRPFDYEEEEEITEEHGTQKERFVSDGSSKRCVDVLEGIRDGSWTECPHCCRCACHRAVRARCNARAAADSGGQDAEKADADAGEPEDCQHRDTSGEIASKVTSEKLDSESTAKLTAAMERISQLETDLAEKTKEADKKAANTSADMATLQQTVSALTAQLRSVETDIHELQIAQAAAASTTASAAVLDEARGGNQSSCSSPPASFSPTPSSISQPIENSPPTAPPLPSSFAASNSVMGPFVSVPLSVLPPRSKLHWDMCEYAAQLQTDSDARLPAQLAAQRLCTATVQSLWPRAQVRPYGSHVTRLVLPSSDVDLVICLPKVRRDAPADAAGMLEGRNAIKETWQQNLARKLRQEPWVVPDSVKTLPHAAIPIITLLTAPPYNVRLDISFEGPGHNGLATNDVVLALLHEFPPLAPMMLVLKSFAIERGLAVAYSGGLSSYALLLLVARYLQEHSDTMPNGFANASRAVQHSLSAAQAGVADFGLMLMGFLDFYGNRFDPRTTGISVASRCFLNRETLAASSSGMTDAPQHQQYQQQYAADDAAVDDRTSQYGYAQHWQVPMQPHHAQSPAPNADIRRYGYRASMDMPPSAGMLEYQQQAYDPHKFDPVFIEDPLRPSNNVGRNCFRIMQIRRAFSAAHLALLAATRDPAVFDENRVPLVAGVGLHPDNSLRAILGPNAPVNAKPDAATAATVGITPCLAGGEHPYAYHPYNQQLQQQYAYQHHHHYPQQQQLQQVYHHVGVSQPRPYAVVAGAMQSSSRRHSESESEKLTTRSVTSAADQYDRVRKERASSPQLVPQSHGQQHDTHYPRQGPASTSTHQLQQHASQGGLPVQDTRRTTSRKPTARSLSFADVVVGGGRANSTSGDSRVTPQTSPLALARPTKFWRDDLALEESITERWETKDDSKLK